MTDDDELDDQLYLTITHEGLEYTLNLDLTVEDFAGGVPTRVIEALAVLMLDFQNGHALFEGEPMPGDYDDGFYAGLSINLGDVKVMQEREWDEGYIAALNDLSTGSFSAEPQVLRTINPHRSSEEGEPS